MTSHLLHHDQRPSSRPLTRWFRIDVRYVLAAAAFALQACAANTATWIPQKALVEEGISKHGGTLRIQMKSSYEFPDPSTFGTNGAAWEGIIYIEPRYPEVEGMMSHLMGHLAGGPGSTCVDSEEIPTRWQAEWLAYNNIRAPSRFHSSRCQPWGRPPDDIAGFATDWVKALLGLQLVLDRDPSKQFLKGIREEYFTCGIQMMGCHAAVVSTYAASSVPEVRELVDTIRSVFEQASLVSEQSRRTFVSTDWSQHSNGGQHWQTTTGDLRAQSERLAVATRRLLLPLLRRDRADHYDEGVLSISRSERDGILRFQRRACEGPILDEYGIDSSRPISLETCRLLTWLGNATQFGPG